MKLALIFIFTSILSPILASDCNHTKNSFRCVEYVKNYDGDTITFNIPNTHPLFGQKISIRVLGLDTPEIRGKNKCEKDKARIAKKLVASQLKIAKRIDLINIKRGKYFRVVADVIYDGKNLKEILIKNKLSYPYDGGRKIASFNWCK